MTRCCCSGGNCSKERRNDSNRAEFAGVPEGDGEAVGEGVEAGVGVGETS